ncbi:MAG: 30S ribosomal protein S8 [candidate division WOR-3 bacterium]|nr:30S ribosomal protein S8 [candidate division WOR-3 bacterium]MCX7757521.1 30S ribosomal protein S8 [candidate division WOR-3 bacterium]
MVKEEATMDNIADMLTRIRNALRAKHKEVRIPYSKMKFEITRILLEEGYINNFIIDGKEPHKYIVIQLKYTENGKPAIYGLKRISHQSRRVYCGYREIPRALNGLGITILSTPKGILTDREARREKVGGEIICQIW